MSSYNAEICWLYNNVIIQISLCKNYRPLQVTFINSFLEYYVMTFHLSVNSISESLTLNMDEYG